MIVSVEIIETLMLIANEDTVYHTNKYSYMWRGEQHKYDIDYLYIMQIIDRKDLIDVRFSKCTCSDVLISKKALVSKDLFDQVETFNAYVIDSVDVY
jgi:hypothetical protein